MFSVARCLDSFPKEKQKNERGEGVASKNVKRAVHGTSRWLNTRIIATLIAIVFLLS